MNRDSQSPTNDREPKDFIVHFRLFAPNLAAISHRTRAIRFCRGFAYQLHTIGEISHFLNQRPDFVNYGIHILITRLLVDHEWQPSVAVLLLLGFCLPYINTLERCPLCGLPHGTWCDEQTQS